MIDRLIALLTTLKTSGLDLADEKKTEVLILALLVFDVVFK